MDTPTRPGYLRISSARDIPRVPVKHMPAPPRPLKPATATVGIGKVRNLTGDAGYQDGRNLIR